MTRSTAFSLLAALLLAAALPCPPAGWCSGPRFSLLWDDSGHVMITRSGPPA